MLKRKCCYFPSYEKRFHGKSPVKTRDQVEGALIDMGMANIADSFCPFTLAKHCCIHKASPQPRLIPLFVHSLITETIHKGPIMKIHPLANMFNQNLPAHPSTDSPLLQKYLFLLLYLVLAAAAFAASPTPWFASLG